MGFPCNKGSKANRYSVTLPLKSQGGGGGVPSLIMTTLELRYEKI